MARKHATIHASTWESESDFRSLSVQAQWLYVALLAQPDLNLCGVMSYVPSRWARFAPGLSTDDVVTMLDELVEHGYLVVDEDAVELWVRSFIYHDRVFAQPQVAMAAASTYSGIHSKALKAMIREAVPPGLREGWPDNFKGISRNEAKALLEGVDAASFKPTFSPNARANARANRSLAEPLAEGSGSGSGSGSALRSSHISTVPKSSCALAVDGSDEGGGRVASA